MRSLSIAFAAALPLAVMAYPKVVLPRATNSTLTTILPNSSFTDFDTFWSYNYPWGTDHNGGARMDQNHTTVSDDGVLSLTATPTSGESPATNGGVQYPINYRSGTVHAKQTFTVQPGGGYDFNAEFVAPTDKGTWPAFWLTAVKGWPPEIDIGEWKGTGKISFNTFNTSSQVTTHDVEYPNATEWHSIKAKIRTADSTDVWVKWFMDGTEVTTQYGANYVGASMYLIIDLQMEGSSGSPGPANGTTFQVRNVEVIDYN